MRAGEARALARALSRLEDPGADADALLAQLLSPAPGTPIIGITGAPGVGKSTLVGQLLSAIRARGCTAAVVAIDPSSPVTGGALLGDRLRMGVHAADPGVFIRSMASRGSVGGLADAAFGVATAMGAAGWERIIIETVGTGQSEVDVAGIADVTIVVTAPGLGDEVQALKAGLLEVGDLLVVNKSDLPGAQSTVRQLESAVALRREVARPAVIAVSAGTGHGIDALVEGVERALVGSGAQRRRERTRDHVRRLLAARCARLVRDAILADSDAVRAACDAVVAGQRGLQDAAVALLHDVTDAARTREPSMGASYRAEGA